MDDVGPGGEVTTTAQVRGMLLEEVLLYLLRISGYRTIMPTDVAADPTLCNHSAGIGVRGRGCEHQIDAIADFMVVQPFSYPQRLLVEAKCLDRRVGVDVVRNALGVLRDVSEHWVATAHRTAPSRRYHYQYALFSLSDYSPTAQRYAFAQDIFLIPLNRSQFFAGVAEAIRRIEAEQFARYLDTNEESLSQLRQAFRTRLQDIDSEDGVNTWGMPDKYEGGLFALTPLIEATSSLRGALVGMIEGQFPILLVPNPDNQQYIRGDDEIRVRIFWDQEGWYLNDSLSNRRLYSFDLPEELVNLYAEHGILTGKDAVDLKARWLGEIRAVVNENGRIYVKRFVLDRDWLESLRDTFPQRTGN